MAVLDRASQAVVLGIVYDGPPEAGKTTTIRALAESFGRQVYTPEEREGRTVYFDWLEHTGGRFDGAPIRCQIVSVPGQDCWLQRRTHLLSRADVVVLVGDTTAAGWPVTLEKLRDLQARLDARDGPPVGVVLQANRRDAPSAVPLALLKQSASNARVALVESIAVDGSGVREAFVLAVRLALDRVREQQRLGALPSREIDGDEVRLLQELLVGEGSAQTAPLPPPEPTAEQKPLRSAAAPSTLPLLPSSEVPSGLVWPPVEGRILLREAILGGAQATVDTDGAQRALLPSGHRAHSPREAAFDDLERGRNALIAWARMHGSAHDSLSKGRCLVLSPGPTRGYRLWQIVRAEPSLRELFIDGCEDMIPRHAARQLAKASRLLIEAQASCAAHGVGLSCTLDSVGISEWGAPIYVGEAPFLATTNNAPSGVQHVARELAELLRHRSADDRDELCRELLSFQRRDPMPAHGANLGELLSRLLAT